MKTCIFELLSQARKGCCKVLSIQAEQRTLCRQHCHPQSTNFRLAFA